MISELFLENFLFISSAKLEFKHGFNVITGETGAGKSVLLEAIKLLLGKRAKTKLVLPGRKEAKIQAIFDISKIPQLQKLLDDLEFKGEDDSELTISRTFRPEGNGRIFINGILANLSQLKSIGVFLIEIHGQNEHQTLLDNKVQRRLLDRFGGEEHLRLVKDLEDSFRKRKEILAELEELKEKIAGSEVRLDELKSTKESLDRLNLGSAKEDQILKEELAKIEHSEKISQEVEFCLQCFEGDGNSEGVIDLLHRAKEAIRRIEPFDSSFKETLERMESHYFDFQDLRGELQRKGAPIVNVSERSGWLQNRLHDIRSACRKWQTDGQGLIDLMKSVTDEIDLLTCPDSSLSKKEREFARADAEFSQVIKAASSQRRKLGRELEKFVIKEMVKLGFNSAVFIVDFKRIEPGATGSESVDFLVSLNPGAQSGPLRKIASGGEVSRVALALKTVLANSDEMPTMVFDEIDTGIGGETALAVSKNLGELGKSKQILVVTHLPQIAKEANSHFTVTKTVASDNTFIEIQKIQGKNREKEIARMLGSANKETLSYARKILAN